MVESAKLELLGSKPSCKKFQNEVWLFDVFIFEHLCTPKNKGGSENRIFGHFLYWHNFSCKQRTKPNLL
jgi:hypothetical protein